MAKRAVFEDVGSARPVAAPGPARADRAARGPIAMWLLLLAGLVALMVVVGGLTRLTDSGLSITTWDPVMGAIPPLDAADWDAAFAAYRTTTEFQEQNAWMTLADFKPIYWWEWGHRFLGRLIGAVWLIGFLWFLVRRQIPAGWTGRLILPGLLGGAQGAVGWWMVASGLTGRLDVAPYRLAVHLGLAFAIFALLLWLAWRVRLEPVALLQARRRRAAAPMGWGGVLLGAVFAQILVGALVAGNDAGRGYVDWPLMQGAILPPESFDLAPLWRNFFENPALVQFCHRGLGYLVFALGLWVVWVAGRAGHRGLRAAGRLVGLALAFQVAWGIATVMHASPLGLAAVHQAGALALIALVLRLRFVAAYPPEQSLRA